MVDNIRIKQDYLNIACMATHEDLRSLGHRRVNRTNYLSLNVRRIQLLKKEASFVGVREHHGN